MFKKSFLIIILTAIFFSAQINAQDEDSDTTNYKDDEEWFNDWDWNWDDQWSGWHHGKPFIELDYGIGKPDHDKLNGKFADVGLIELKLGYVSFYDRSDETIIEFNERYAFASRLATDLKSTDDNYNKYESDLWRFGFGRRSGYGYSFDKVKILPYTQHAAVWSKLEVDGLDGGVAPALDDILFGKQSESEILKRFDGEFRFGTLSEGGIRLEAASFISFNAGYEAAVIFPRHMFWKHLGSFIIETAGLEALDKFVDEVIDSSPFAGPIVNFLLKNGYSYAFYLLKKEKMNWPFNTEAPLTYETFKIGVTFTF
ncbi:MAG: hypothetical protein HYS25_07975 [Ignavibacteriales bacterium]|nr:hypothetical protein [Ignavibacteriales bacterium]